MQKPVFSPNASSYLALQEELPLSHAGFIALAIIVAFSTGPANVLNATVIIVPLMYKQLRQPLNYALVNVAVADLGTAVTRGILSVVNNARGYFSLGRTGCVMEGFTVSLCGITSVYSHSDCSREDVCSVQADKLPKEASCWGYCLLLAVVPPLFDWGRYDLEGVWTSCTPDWHSPQPHNVSYILVYFAVCFVVLFVIILVSYIKLMWTLHRVSIFKLEH